MKKIRTTPRFLKELKLKKNGDVICLNCWTITGKKIVKIGDGPRSMKNVNEKDRNFMYQF